eukprot:TRINITY_DN11083_c0_g1_i2.p1 TRINITY_DN11083_c0_g1~~TRINITY_DN11083_c0_g1_i2.p1  ORF type:complete len:1134 (+),score=330.60 TRINITY_DN11083_c0_g1_i2:964-4365(+)
MESSAVFFTRQDFAQLRSKYRQWRKLMRGKVAQMEVEYGEHAGLRRYEEENTERRPEVDLQTFERWLNEIKLTNEDPREAEKKQAALDRVVQRIRHLDTIDVEAFIRFYEMDPSVRFDIQYCQYQKRMALDTLALFAYVPFVFLFAYFLVQDKGLGTGYWMNNNIDGFFPGQEFDVSDSLRFAKYYSDIGSDEEFWQFVEGPMLGGLWAGDDDDSTATDLVQESLMPIGGLKVRQLRVAGRECPEQQTRLFGNNIGDLMKMPGGREYVRSRLEDFNPLCYPELHYEYRGLCLDGKGCPQVDTGPYYLTRLHDGSIQYSMDDPRNPIGWNTGLANSTSLPPMFVEKLVFDKNTSGIQENEKFVLEAYEYHTCRQFNSSVEVELQGKMGTYGCEGHGMVFPFNWTKSRVAEAMGILKNGIHLSMLDAQGRQIEKTVPWIDVQTRAISFDLIFYCKNINLFSHAQFLVEITASGTWIPVKQYTSFQMFDANSHGFAYFFFVAVYYLYITVYCITWLTSFVSDIMRHNDGRREVGHFLHSVWNAIGFWVLFDFINLTLFCIAWYYTALQWGEGLRSVLQVSYYPDGYEKIAKQGQVAAFVSAGNALFTFCRIFYFLQLHPQLNLLTKTVHKAASDLLGIVIIFIIVFMAFSLVAYAVYGLALEDFRTFGQTVITMCRMLLGDFDFEQLQTERRIMTPIIFALYNALAVFILLNMVIAILDDAFGNVQEEKYTPSKLLKLMASSDDPEFDPQGDQNRKNVVFQQIANNPLAKEFMWWFRRGYLKFLLVSGQHHATEDVYLEKVRYADRRNPRIYWAQRLDDMERNIKTYPFSDKCRLMPRQLDDILMDHFGKDFKLLVNDLVWEPAQKMQRKPDKLLRDVLQFHHFWKQEVEAITRTGKTIKAQKEEQQKEFEQKMRQIFLRQQEKYKEESRQDTFRRLRLKYGRDPTTEELMNEMAAMPPDNKQDIEKWWMYQIRRLHQITETFTKLAETRDRNFSGGGPKLKFTEWMIEKVSKAMQRQLTESMGGIVQEEIQEEMTTGDKDTPAEARENMPSVLRKWRDGVYDREKKTGKLKPTNYMTGSDDSDGSDGSAAEPEHRLNPPFTSPRRPTTAPPARGPVSPRVPTPRKSPRSPSKPAI